MLTKEDKKLIEEKTKEAEALEDKAEKLREEVQEIRQSNCNHDWGCWEHYHNDEFRDCRKCGKTEWR